MNDGRYGVIECEEEERMVGDVGGENVRER